MSIIIDPEFKSLIPPLSEEEFNQLEENCIKEGIRDALVVWPQGDGNDILIDGHNRWNIVARHNGTLAFDIKRIAFKDRDEAEAWIIKNQFGRRNLSAYDRSVLALKLKPLIAKQAEQRMKAGKANPNQKSDEGMTSKQLGKIAGVSHDTIHKVETIEKKALPEVKEKVRSGEMTINQAYKEVKKPHVSFNSGNNEWYTPSEFIEAARQTMGSIDLDPASNEIANRVVKATQIYTIETDGLSKTWEGNIWLNPPYSSDLVSRFVNKLVEERKNYKQAVVLVNNATETEWFYRLISIADAVCFPKGRVKFYMPDGKTGAPLQGQAVVYVGDNEQEFLMSFKDLGWGCSVVGL